MTKRFWNFILLLILSVNCFAIPAKRGVFKTITLVDGSQVRAELCGDEHKHFWKAADGRTFVEDAVNDYYVAADVASVTDELAVAPSNIVSGPKRTSGVQPSEPIVGNRKGLIVLVQFSDVKFQEGHDKAFYDKVANKKGFSESPFVGSVRDYFYDQSEGQLDYTFDIAGIVDLPEKCSYYGKNSGTETQVNMKYLLSTALEAIKDTVDFSKYDNDGDNWVDNIFFIYAGYGEADGGGSETIWPHMYYYRTGYQKIFMQNGVQVDVYACANEEQSDDIVNGIGPICHEFSHCLGLPDMYDTGTVGNYGNSYWDLMHAGCYNGNTFRPAGYTGYERDYVGWHSIVPLEEDITITSKGISEGGTSYSMVNPANKNESFILEPRTKSGWDADLPGYGLLIYHLDYNSSAWTRNTVNNTKNHQRMAIVAADNDYTSSDINIKNDAYPYGGNNVFSDNTTPASTLFNANLDGSNKLGKSIYDICKNVDGTISFSYMDGTYVYENNAPEGSLFYESFGRCAGTGGNDGYFSGEVATEEFVADNDGWVSANKFAGYKCAKFGTNRQNGNATTPEITLDGAAKLTFKAATYASECSSITLSVASGGATLADTSFKIATKDEWNEFSTTIEGTGAIKLKFAGIKRFFLDDILLMPDNGDGIENLTLTHSQDGEAIYNLAGQKVNADYKGVVIVNGKKVYRF